MPRRLLHIVQGEPEGDLQRLIEEQVRSGHRVEVALLGGARGWRAPEGCAATLLDPAGRGEDARRLLDLVYACDNAVFW